MSAPAAAPAALTAAAAGSRRAAGNPPREGIIWDDRFMGDSTEYAIGAGVSCEDGDRGHLRRVVIDPVARVVTHLVVDPGKWSARGRLVPIGLVDSAGDGICLRCSCSEFDALEDAEETHFLATTGEQLGYGSGEMYTWPYYGLGSASDLGPGMMGLPPVITEDRVPVGDVEIRRGEQVHATDGDIGRLHGLVIDPDDHHVTHILLEDGHLWGKRRVAIPIGAVTKVSSGDLRLSLTRDQVRELPSLEQSGGEER